MYIPASWKEGSGFKTKSRAFIISEDNIHNLLGIPNSVRGFTFNNADVNSSISISTNISSESA